MTWGRVKVDRFSILLDSTALCIWPARDAEDRFEWSVPSRLSCVRFIILPSSARPSCRLLRICERQEQKFYNTNYSEANSICEQVQALRCKVQVGAALTFWQTLFNLWRWSRVSWGFCRYWGSSACKTRMEKGTIEPRPWKTKTQRDINTNACSFSSAKTKCTIFLFSLLFFCQETHCRNRLHAGETRAWGFDHVPLWYQDSGRILKHRPESSTASPSEDFTWPTA